MIAALILAVTIAVLDTGIDLGHTAFSNTVVSTYNVVTEEIHTPDVCDHGTAVAGIVAKEAPAANLLVINMFSETCHADLDDVEEAILYAIDYGVDTILVNVAIVSPTAAIEQAVEQAVAAGITVVAPAGNASTSEPRFPAAWPDVIGVGGTNVTSSYGDWVDIIAPGAGVEAPKAGGGIGYYSGTSFAAPLVAAQTVHTLSFKYYVPQLYQ